MHQDHVAGRCSILDDLERNSIYLFDALVKTGNTLSWIATGRQIPEVRVPFERSPELQTASTVWRSILRKPFMDETMRPAEDVHASTAWSDIGQHRVDHHATGR